jgi:hypothetical protein
MIGDATLICDRDVMNLARLFAFSSTSHALSSHERSAVKDIAQRFLVMGRSCHLSTLDRELMDDISMVFGLEEVAA